MSTVCPLDPNSQALYTRTVRINVAGAPVSPDLGSYAWFKTSAAGSAPTLDTSSYNLASLNVLVNNPGGHRTWAMEKSGTPVDYLTVRAGGGAHVVGLV